jgi:NAD(P)-dependent dehydrogenase (short-subunit alcohol dehydrogenase family)
MEFQDRHVVVTGGTGALGSAVVGLLLEAGATCHIPVRDLTDSRRFAHRGHDRVVLAPVPDLTDEAAVTAFYAGLPALWASIHIAGGFAMAPIGDTDKAALQQQLDTNLVTGFLCCRAAVAAIGRGAAGGRIVNVSSRPGLEWRQGAGMVAYTAAKAALSALTVALAQEVAGQGILVNAVAPSTMDTPTNRAAMPKADPAAWAKVEEVAATILFLASPRNQVTRGAVVPSYGKS